MCFICYDDLFNEIVVCEELVYRGPVEPLNFPG